MSAKSTLPNNSIGLNEANISEANFGEAVWKYVAKKHSGAALNGSPLEQAPIPKGTVGEAHAMRRRILELSIAPDITHRAMLKVKGSSRLG